jgi:hypothetical protein
LGAATFAPLDALSSGRASWLQQVAVSPQRWFRRDQAPAALEASSQTLEFGQPMIPTPASPVLDGDRTVDSTANSTTSSTASSKAPAAGDRTAELQALQSGLEDIPVPIYVTTEQPTQALSGTLYELRHQSYMLVADAGQRLTVQLDAVDAELSVLDAQKRPVSLDAELTQHWQGELPGGDRYYIRVIGKGEYRLNVQLRAAEDLAE